MKTRIGIKTLFNNIVIRRVMIIAFTVGMLTLGVYWEIENNRRSLDDGVPVDFRTLTTNN